MLSFLKLLENSRKRAVRNLAVCYRRRLTPWRKTAIKLQSLGNEQSLLQKTENIKINPKPFKVYPLNEERSGGATMRIDVHTSRLLC